MTAPVLSDATAKAITTTTAALSVRSDTKNGTMYFVVVPNAVTTPNAAQIIAGTDGDGAAATWVNSIPVASIDSYRPGPSGLTNGVAYKACGVHQNAAAENSNVVTATFTGGSTDSTAPVLTSFSVSSISTASVTMTVTTDEGNGTIFWAIVKASEPQPNANAVINGLNGVGQPATFAASLAVSSTGAKTKGATGLAADTSYIAYAAQRDTAGNVSNKVTAGFSTLEAVTISYMLPGVFTVDTDSDSHFFNRLYVIEDTAPVTSRRSWMAAGRTHVYFNDSVTARQQMLASIFIR
jgi:hypothetical protein